MRSEELDRALGETPPSFVHRMDQTLRGLKEEKEMKRVAFRTVVLVTLITLLLCATAIALVSQGLEWYYNNRFTAYQENEPEKHDAIMEHLQTELPQTAPDDPDIQISVTEASWAQEQNVLVISLLATARYPEQSELHPMWNLDADGSYVGDSAPDDVTEDGEDRSEHWLWTPDGFGPVDEMVAPGKQLLLLDCGTPYLDGLSLDLVGASMDAYVNEDGAVHTVLELSLDFLQDDYIEKQRQRLAENPEFTFLLKNIETAQELQQRLQGASSVTCTVPYTVTYYTEDDMLLYTGGRTEEISFTLNLDGVAPTPAAQTLREGDQGAPVTALQERLAALDYLAETTGVYDPDTVAAVKAFQEDNRLPADGIAGPNTLQLLHAGVCE